MITEGYARRRHPLPSFPHCTVGLCMSSTWKWSIEGMVTVAKIIILYRVDFCISSLNVHGLLCHHDPWSGFICKTWNFRGMDSYSGDCEILLRRNSSVRTRTWEAE